VSPQPQALAALSRGVSDFQLALYLVPAPLRRDEAVLALEECEKLLQVRCIKYVRGKACARQPAPPHPPARPPARSQVGKFSALWAATRAPALAGPLAAIPGFADGVRGFMIAVLGRMYQRIGTAELGGYLDLAPHAAAAFAVAAGWVLEDDGITAAAPLIADNQPRPKAAFDEGLKYADVAGLVR
jgi:hypothetical protein